MHKINVLSLQFTPISADKKQNIEKVKELIKNDGKDRYDIIVLPEFFDTGINITNEQVFELAEKEKNSFILSELSKIAKQYNLH